MGKLRAFKICIDNNPRLVFRSGDTIQGHVLLDLAQPMQMRSIKIQFCGEARVHWTERHSTGSGKNRRTVTRHYNNDETYFNNTVIVWGSASGGGLFSSSPEHPAGQHIYPFVFQLPPNLPSSFEGAWGRIPIYRCDVQGVPIIRTNFHFVATRMGVRYSVSGTVDKPWKFDHNTKAAFTVHSNYDLNMEPRARQPLTAEKSKTLCCLCCTSGPITGKLQVPRTGYVPGEFISINAEVDNKSNRTMANSKLKLLMVTTFHARSKSRSSTRTVQELTRGEIPEGESDSWRNQSIHIPPLPPSQLIHCNIIDIKYLVQLIVDPTGPAFDLEVAVEVLLGTVPLVDVSGLYSQSAFSAPPLPALTEMDNPPAPVFTQPSAPQAATMGAPPPSYAECVFGNVDIREDKDNEYTQGDLNYTPVYSYYSWDQQQPQQQPPPPPLQQPHV